MNVLTICPCCSSRMLRYLSNHREYWFCRHCWSEMPDWETQSKLKPQQVPPVVNLSTSSIGLQKPLLVSQSL